MHLFIVDGKKEQGTYRIDNLGCIHQITRVLRMRPGDFLMIQQKGAMVRYEVCIESIASNTIMATIVSETQGPSRSPYITMVIAMPNKFEKAELIVQKCAEVGVDEIIFRPARRSIIRVFPDKKMERCAMIAQEATEQSRGRYVPVISRSNTIPLGIHYDEQLLIDYHAQSHHPFLYAGRECALSGNKRIAYIGPEGGFHDDEYAFFAPLPMKQVVLGNHVLRMETAAITSSWWLSTARNKTTSIGVTIVK